jgi:hypothetical protein
VQLEGAEARAAAAAASHAQVQEEMGLRVNEAERALAAAREAAAAQEGVVSEATVMVGCQ